MIDLDKLTEPAEREWARIIGRYRTDAGVGARTFTVPIVLKDIRVGTLKVSERSLWKAFYGKPRGRDERISRRLGLLPRLHVAPSARAVSLLRGLLSRQVPQARQIVKKLLDGVITFTPERDGVLQGWRFRSGATFENLLVGSPWANTVASPTRLGKTDCVGGSDRTFASISSLIFRLIRRSESTPSFP